MIGIQIPILLALFEYAFILALNRNLGEIKIDQVRGLAEDGEEQRQSQIEKNETTIKLMDRYTEIGSAIFFIVFNICYCMIALMK